MSADINQGTSSKSEGLESVNYNVFDGEDENKWNDTIFRLWLLQKKRDG